MQKKRNNRVRNQYSQKQAISTQWARKYYAANSHKD